MASLCDVCIKVQAWKRSRSRSTTCRCTMRFVCVWKKNFSGNECFKASLRSGLKLQFSETNKNSRHRNASHFSVPAVFGRIGYHSAKLGTKRVNRPEKGRCSEVFLPQGLHQEKGFFSKRRLFPQIRCRRKLQTE